MKTTTYPGINYAGFGNANRDPLSLIRYGVIPHHAVGSAWYDSSEGHYGKPGCPKCGNEAIEVRSGFDYECECGAFVCQDCDRVHYPMELDDGACPDCNGAVEKTEFTTAKYECGDFACHGCGLIFGAESAFPDSPLSHYVNDDEISAEQGGEDCDIFVSKSKFFTYAQFCSPCAPGACYLLNPLESEEFTVTENDVLQSNNVHPDTRERLPIGTYSAKPSADNRAYCFGHDWFEDGVAPYPVYSVATAELVLPAKR